jgi:predicted peroxiredoxin
MKLGILVNTARHPDHLAGIVHAAAAKGHTVIIFVMDEGAVLLEQDVFRQLCSLPDVSMSYCDLNAQQCAVDKGKVPPAAVCGSQYNNAVMFHDADRVIVL